ncbi:hypothetical protein OSB04_011902 [Centaurea solstitialis]|uniref:Reverse transcriptase domain-containing protein n=1 Tax=Centaurea solstitialis TaxID=347529 RepID=A0AA38TV37_9ASTR|nr:hypothetical protein OSB04_011902 [Centaurea solstitialis]
MFWTDSHFCRFWRPWNGKVRKRRKNVEIGKTQSSEHFASASIQVWRREARKDGKSRGVSRRNGDTDDFATYFEDIDLFDIRFSGIHYTWCQKPKTETGLRRKFDRCLANTDFMELFIIVSVRFLPRGLSDHSPGIISFKEGHRIPSYGNLSNTSVALKEELDVAQLAADFDPGNVNLEQEVSRLRDAYQSLVGHASFLHSISNADGVFVYDDEVPKAFIDHFIAIIGTLDGDVQPEVTDLLFDEHLSIADSNHMIRPIQDDEIRQALFSIGNDKAPGSDGLAKELNHTLLCLLPKVQGASMVSNFRPIACCSVLYKCISKVIVERMKPYLDRLVSKSQSAFIPGRRIGDNILMAHELVTGYHLDRGDPLSPYQFTLVMEGFSLIMRKCIAEASSFGYHYGCQDIQLTHLCFADDLFVFTRGDVESVEILKKALAIFASKSGLAPNLQKSDFFFGNVAPNPADFAPIVSKVKLRIHNWKSKFLSFGGRKQLVISVLQSLQLYCMAVFLFPLGVVHELEKLFRDFIWAQGDSSRGKIKRTTRWSWVLAKLMSIRSDIRHFITIRIGDGDSTNAWEDNWLSCGPLASFVPYRLIHSVGFTVDATVKQLVDTFHDGWPEGNEHGRFTVRNAYDLFEGILPIVPWWESVWFKGHIPKHSFCLWTACLNRLPTLDRLAAWKEEPPDLSCRLCSISPESHDHLFFECSFSRQVWLQVMGKMAWLDFPCSWSDIMLAISDQSTHPTRL